MTTRKQWIHDLGEAFGSLAELAREAGLAYAHLNAVANGRRELSPGMLATLASVAWVYGRQDLLPAGETVVAALSVAGAPDVTVQTCLRFFVET